MNGRRRSRVAAHVVLVLSLIVPAVALEGCGEDNPTSASPSAVASTPTITRTREIRIVNRIPYTTQADHSVALLDVYAPKQTGPWPLVVMLHGEGQEDVAALNDWAAKTARRGAVVFVPEWGQFSPFLYSSSPLTVAVKELRAASKRYLSDVATVVRFARATGARYGGDPQHLTLFGHCTGGNLAAMEAFGRTAASQGALEGAGSTIPESLVLFESDPLIAEPSWDEAVAADAGLMRLVTPWRYLGRRVDFPITVIAVDDPAMRRELATSWAKDSWFAARDPSGELRQGLARLGASGGNLYSMTEQKLLARRLRAAGDRVTWVKLTDSSHATLGDDGMKSLLDALVPKTQP